MLCLISFLLEKLDWLPIKKQSKILTLAHRLCLSLLWPASPNSSSSYPPTVRHHTGLQYAPVTCQAAPPLRAFAVAVSSAWRVLTPHPYLADSFLSFRP